MAGLTPPDAGRAIFRRRRQRPILPLGTDQLLGGPGSRPAAVDALAARTLVKGEPLVPPAGRADDFVWPQREIGQEQVKGETPDRSTATGVPAPRKTKYDDAQREAEQAGRGSYVERKPGRLLR